MWVRGDRMTLHQPPARQHVDSLFLHGDVLVTAAPNSRPPTRTPQLASPEQRWVGGGALALLERSSERKKDAGHARSCHSS